MSDVADHCYTVLDLFSGIGGFSLGLERTGGFRTIAFCEIKPFQRSVLKKHWPNVPIFEDIRSYMQQTYQEQLTLFAEVSHAKTSVEQGKCEESRENKAHYGGICTGLSKKLPRNMCLRKMWQGCALTDLLKCSTALSRSGMMLNGIVYQDIQLAPLKKGIGFTLWPTPCSRGLPGGGPVGLGGGSAARKKLDMMVGVETRKAMCSSGLNPTWTEWLMGYPLRWTE